MAKAEKITVKVSGKQVKKLKLQASCMKCKETVVPVEPELHVTPAKSQGGNPRFGIGGLCGCEQKTRVHRFVGMEVARKLDNDAVEAGIASSNEKPKNKKKAKAKKAKKGKK